MPLRDIMASTTARGLTRWSAPSCPYKRVSCCVPPFKYCVYHGYRTRRYGNKVMCNFGETFTIQNGDGKQWRETAGWVDEGDVYTAEDRIFGRLPSGGRWVMKGEAV